MAGTDEPQPKSYRPFVAARYPLQGGPEEKPEWRLLVHRKHVAKWNELADRCGDANAGECWLHLTSRPNRPPLLGTVTPMKGDQHKSSGTMSRVFHYEVTGAARVDYRYDPEFVVSDGKGDKHPVVQIISIDFGSH